MHPDEREREVAHAHQDEERHQDREWTIFEHLPNRLPNRLLKRLFHSSSVQRFVSG